MDLTNNKKVTLIGYFEKEGCLLYNNDYIKFNSNTNLINQEIIIYYKNIINIKLDNKILNIDYINNNYKFELYDINYGKEIILKYEKNNYKDDINSRIDFNKVNIKIIENSETKIIVGTLPFNSKLFFKLFFNDNFGYNISKHYENYKSIILSNEQYDITKEENIKYYKKNISFKKVAKGVPFVSYFNTNNEIIIKKEKKKIYSKHIITSDCPFGKDFQTEIEYHITDNDDNICSLTITLLINFKKHIYLENKIKEYAFKECRTDLYNFIINGINYLKNNKNNISLHKTITTNKPLTITDNKFNQTEISYNRYSYYNMLLIILIVFTIYFIYFKIIN